ncbi:hypothetical protein [Oceanobacter kriegii]|uniref:hypothetical protein n=1 Tax=Oceanobacter kriegii TaxID=64972 RepID=UPI00056C8EBA|nr:hypothetical protein [Oceanobacter kriegii]
MGQSRLDVFTSALEAVLNEPVERICWWQITSATLFCTSTYQGRKVGLCSTRKGVWLAVKRTDPLWTRFLKGHWDTYPLSVRFPDQTLIEAEIRSKLDQLFKVK